MDAVSVRGIMRRAEEEQLVKYRTSKKWLTPHAVVAGLQLPVSTNVGNYNVCEVCIAVCSVAKTWSSCSTFL